jgi:hypothetical protein
MSPTSVFALPSRSAFARRAVGRNVGRWAFADWPRSLPPPPVGGHLAQDHAHFHTAHLPPAGTRRSRTLSNLDRTRADGGDSPSLGADLRLRVNEQPEPVRIAGHSITIDSLYPITLGPNRSTSSPARRCICSRITAKATRQHGSKAGSILISTGRSTSLTPPVTVIQPNVPAVSCASPVECGGFSSRTRKARSDGHQSIRETSLEAIQVRTQ